MLRELAYALAGLLTGFFGVIAIRGVPDEWEKASISPSFWQDEESLVSCSLWPPHCPGYRMEETPSRHFQAPGGQGHWEQPVRIREGKSHLTCSTMLNSKKTGCVNKVRTREESGSVFSFLL